MKNLRYSFSMVCGKTLFVVVVNITPPPPPSTTFRNQN